MPFVSDRSEEMRDRRYSAVGTLLSSRRVRLRFRLRADLLFYGQKVGKNPLFCRGAGKPFGWPVPAPAGGVLSLAQEKVPKECAGGWARSTSSAQGALSSKRLHPRTPVKGTGASVEVLTSLSGVLNPRLRRSPRRPPACCVLTLRCLRPRGPAWNGDALRRMHR